MSGKCLIFSLIKGVRTGDEQIYLALIAGACIIFICVFLVFLFYKSVFISNRPLINQENTYKSKMDSSKFLAQDIIDFAQSDKFYISEQKEAEIKSKLEEFEKSLDFLQTDFSLAELANKIGENRRYLSHVINKHQGMSFTSYINDLRINYILDCLNTQPKFREYKISYLAKCSGFASHSRFTINFKKVSGESPSEYIRKLKGDASNSAS
ncbi:helix-turn-helix domain-containing protein [Myroides sp. LJL119]